MEKTYTKTHQNTTAMSKHKAAIKKRGGKFSVKGNTITYQFKNKKK